MDIHTKTKTTTFPILIFFIAFQFIFLSTVWAQSKRNNKKSPDYSIVFPQNKVNRIDITITADNWQKLNNNLASKFGKFNKGFMPGPPPNRMGDSINPPWKRDSMRMPPWESDSAKRINMPPPHLKGGWPPFPGGVMGRPGKMGPPPFSDSIPDIFVPATITFQGKKWKNTGFRFKGNSSLMMSWSRGIKKMPFRLNFSKFGDSITKVKKQRFFGFKELTFSNNISDNSFLHEKIASDLFREAGIKAPHTAFYEVYINYGEGLQYVGLYTTIEIVEDALLKNQFGSDKGNCYKPDGQAGSFANGSFNEKAFNKKTNKKKNDYNDVRKLYTVLHSSTRISNPALWKAQLDSIFDIPVFLKWLAINTTIHNWDTYGFMPHNYYLYNNPSTEKLTWIPWDNNESLASGKREELSLSLSEITEDWPLIRYLLDQPKYAEIYRSEIRNFIEGAFENNKVKEKIEAYYKLIYPYVTAEKQGFTFLPSTNSFIEAKNSLIKHVTNRLNIAQKFIEQNINKDQENIYIDTTSFESSARHWYFISDAHNIIYPTPNQPRYRASEITKIADNILLYQRNNGGWPKNYDMQAILTPYQKDSLINTKGILHTTFDNSTTFTHIEYLAQACNLTGIKKYKEGCLQGLDFIFSAQYPNGGWPQYFPLEKGYSRYITYNDNAMIGIMKLLKDILDNKPYFSFLDNTYKEKTNIAFQKGVSCILKCQIKEKGVLTAWCQQHHEKTLKPVWARAFEPPSISNQESANIVLFLMKLKNPNKDVIRAIQGAIQWFNNSKIYNARVDVIKIPTVQFKLNKSSIDRVVVIDSTAPPIWTRYYELKTHRPLFCDRNGKFLYSLAEVSHERRSGYGWYTYEPQQALDKYSKWKKKYNP